MWTSVAATVAVLAWSASVPWDDIDGGVRNVGQAGVVEVEALHDGSDDVGSDGASTVSDGPADRYQRHAICVEWTDGGDGLAVVPLWPGDIPPCGTDYVPPADFCMPGSTPIDPLWVSRVQPDGSYSSWQMVTGYECTASPLPAAIAAAWQQMTIDPSAFVLTPDLGWAIATWGVTPNVDESAQQQNVTVLGFDVLLRATPAGFSWTTDDGTGATNAITSEGPAGEAITFARREHRAQLSVTTTWTGDYSLDGGATWTPAPGTATTTTTQSLHVFNPRAHLVNCNLDGHCTDGNRAPTHPLTVTDPDADGIDNHTIPDADIDAYLATRKAGRDWTSRDRIG